MRSLVKNCSTWQLIEEQRNKGPGLVYANIPVKFIMHGLSGSSDFVSGLHLDEATKTGFTNTAQQSRGL